MGIAATFSKRLHNWTSDNGFFGEGPDLREQAGELLASGWLP